MNIDQNTVLLAAIILAALILIGILVMSFVNKYKDKKDTEGAAEFSNNTAVNSGDASGAADVINSIEKNKLAAAQKALKNFHPAPIAQKIYESGGVFNDDEDKLYSAFNQLKSKLELAELNIYFKSAYGKTILDYLNDHFDYTEISKVNTIIGKLKPY